MKALDALSESFLARHPLEAALVLEGVEEKTLARFLGRMEPQAAGRVAEHFDPEVTAACLGRMTLGAAAAILAGMNPHARDVALRQMPARRREGALSHLDEQTAEQARRMLRFPGDSVASLMDTQVLTLPEDMRVDEAMRRIRRIRRQPGEEVYVLDRKHRLVGVTTLYELLVARPDQTVSESMQPDCPRLFASTPQRSLLGHPLWAAHNSVAVVDADEVLLGVVDHRTVASAAEKLPARRQDEGLEAALALGELYWMGLTGMLDGLAGRALAESTKEDANRGKDGKS